MASHACYLRHFPREPGTMRNGIRRHDETRDCRTLEGRQGRWASRAGRRAVRSCLHRGLQRAKHNRQDAVQILASELRRTFLLGLRRGV
ncbi:MAG: hypothetical protein K6E52_02210 [Bacteroidaceae bacterium]|nr:hypothetical protein [Bacteroidaceae bacterium]